MAAQAILNALAEVLPSDPQSDGVTSASSPLSTIGNATHPTPISRDLSILSLPSLLLSLIIKNQDVLKLLVIGGLIETFRRFAAQAWNWFLDSCFLTAYFEDSDDSFQWIMVWLAKQNFLTKPRQVNISTSCGRTHRKGIEILGLSDDVDTAEQVFQNTRRLAYLPAYGTTHWLKYKHTWMSVSRTKHDPQDAWSRKEDIIQISLFTRDHRLLRSLLQDAKRMYKAEDQDTVDIYSADQYNQWHCTSTRKRRPLKSIVLEPEAKNKILDDAKDFLYNEQWYIERGIPYRRGYLLHGVPGSGKTSLIHSIAGELGLDVYVVSLAKRGLDDSSLNELICALPLRSIALMEDIDAAFHHAAIARDGVSGSSSSDLAPPGIAHRVPSDTQGADTKGVTLSGLLGALDGLAAQEGRILFATTNRYEALDEALCRPGRMDVHLEFKMATRWQARELFRCFFPPVGVGELSEKLAPDTPARRIAADLSQEAADSLADSFADMVPEGQFSMASLQGHLMRFKGRPHEAVDTAKEWVEKELRQRHPVMRNSKA